MINIVLLEPEKPSNTGNIGIDEFGMSAPGSKIMDHFGFTTEKIVEKIKEYL